MSDSPLGIHTTIPIGHSLGQNYRLKNTTPPIHLTHELPKPLSLALLVGAWTAKGGPVPRSVDPDDSGHSFRNSTCGLVDRRGVNKTNLVDKMKCGVKGFMDIT